MWRLGSIRARSVGGLTPFRTCRARSEVPDLIGLSAEVVALVRVQRGKSDQHEVCVAARARGSKSLRWSAAGHAFFALRTVSPLLARAVFSASPAAAALARLRARERRLPALRSWFQQCVGWRAAFRLHLLGGARVIQKEEKKARGRLLGEKTKRKRSTRRRGSNPGFTHAKRTFYH